MHGGGRVERSKSPVVSLPAAVKMGAMDGGSGVGGVGLGQIEGRGKADSPT